MKRVNILLLAAVLASVIACQLVPATSKPTESHAPPTFPVAPEEPSLPPEPTAKPAPTVPPISSPTTIPTPESLPSLEEISQRYKADITPQIERIQSAQQAPSDFAVPSLAESQVHFLPLSERQYQVQYLLFREQVFGNPNGKDRFLVVYSYERDGCLSWIGFGCDTQGVRMTGRLLIEANNSVYLLDELPTWTGGAGARTSWEIVERAIPSFDLPGAEAGEIEKLLEILVGFTAGYDPLESAATYAQPSIPARVAILRLALGSPYWADRETAVDSIAELGPAAAELIPELILALDDEEFGVRSGAAGALGVFGPQAAEAVPALIRFLEEANYSDCSAITTLGNIGSSAAAGVPALVKALENKNEYVRRCACRAIGNIGPAASEAVPALAVALQDANEDVRRYAAEALGKIGPAAAEAVPALVLALEDPNNMVRLNATKALGLIGPGAIQAVPALIKLLGSESLSTRKAAQESLKSITGADYGEDAAAWQKWWDENHP